MEIDPLRAVKPLALVETPVTDPQRAGEVREIVSAVKALNKAEFMGPNSELAFRNDRQSGRPVIQIVDRNSKEVITQIPPEYVLRIAEALKGKSSHASL